MYAVVKTGGKQYRVAKDDVLTVEKLDGEAGAVHVEDRLAGERVAQHAGGHAEGTQVLAARLVHLLADLGHLLLADHEPGGMQ